MARARVTLVINGKRHALKWDAFASAFVKVFNKPRPALAPYVLAELMPVHTHKCAREQRRRWRRGDDRPTLCPCGAEELLRQLTTPKRRLR